MWRMPKMLALWTILIDYFYLKLYIISTKKKKFIMFINIAKKTDFLIKKILFFRVFYGGML